MDDFSDEMMVVGYQSVSLLSVENRNADGRIGTRAMAEVVSAMDFAPPVDHRLKWDERRTWLYRRLDGDCRCWIWHEMCHIKSQLGFHLIANNVSSIWKNVFIVFDCCHLTPSKVCPRAAKDNE